MNTFILGYGFIQCAFFGLLVGLAAEEAKNWKHYAFLWLLAMGWPIIVAWKVFCEKEAKA